MEANRIVLEAIAIRRCVSAIYNRMRVTLAPHILYTRHDELFIDAITIERDGLPPKEIKLGTFKLIGLNELQPADRSFEPEAIFNPADPKYQGVTLFAV